MAQERKAFVSVNSSLRASNSRALPSLVAQAVEGIRLAQRALVAMALGAAAAVVVEQLPVRALLAMVGVAAMLLF